MVYVYFMENIGKSKKMITGGTPMTKRKPPNGKLWKIQH
jgi:hypothetical protein